MNIAILDKYLAKQIIGIILLVSLALLGIDLFFNLVVELKIIGKGKYTLGNGLSYLMLTAPTRFYAMFPWAALIGTLIALSMLANHRELVVMRTAAVSVSRICFAVIKGAFFLTFFVVLLGEGLAPLGDRIAQNNRTLAISGGQSIETAYGVWVRNGQEFIHVQTIRANGDLSGVTRYQFDENRKLKEVSIAETAVKEAAMGRWRLYNIQGTRFLPKKTEVMKSETEYVSSLLEPEILETAAAKHPERLSLFALWRTIQNRIQNELNAQNYELAFWSKICQPLLILIMVFIAVPFVFGPLRSASMGFRILAGILVAYLFHTLNGMMAPLAMVYQVPPLLAVLLPLMVFVAVGFILLKRVK